MRCRIDGWTPARQAAFLGALAETGSVTAAARRVGLARETAYRLRRRPGAGSFVAAWDRAAAQGDRFAQADRSAKRKVTAEERAQRALFGLLKVRMYRGRHVATERKADNSALLGHLAQLDRAGRAGGNEGTRVHGFAPGFVSTGCWP